jgi:hypothetical protein
VTKALSVECISNTRCCSRSICGRFNVGKAIALRTVRRVANALINLAPTFIVWPSGQYLEEVKHGFNQMGFPNTIGAVDGKNPSTKRIWLINLIIHMSEKLSMSYFTGVCLFNLWRTNVACGSIGI